MVVFVTSKYEEDKNEGPRVATTSCFVFSDIQGQVIP